MSEMLTIALAKGRLADGTLELLERCGVDTAAVRRAGRKLVVEDNAQDLRFMLVKPCDVPTYVEYGVADMGVCGSDTLLESGRSLYEMAELDFGRCALCVCGRTLPDKGVLKVATKYPNIAAALFATRGREVELIELGGSVELAAIVGLSDVILDIVESGETLRANGLSVLERVFPISAKIVVNRVSLKTRAKRIRGLLERIEKENGQ